MPIAVTTDLVDVNLSEATTNYAVIGTFATGIAPSVDTYVQASNTVGGRVSANTAWAHTSTGGVDLSVSERHVFQWLKCISIPQLDTKANGGLGITISSDVTPTLVGTSPSNGPSNSKTWYVGGVADALSGWVCYAVDPNSTPDLTLGTPVVTGINRIGIRAKIVGTVGGGSVKPVNIVFDATRYGTGLTYTGDASGTPGTFGDILDTAMSTANAWGILTADSSIFFGAGKFDYGTTGQAATSSFKSVNELFVWRQMPVAATFYAFRVRGSASFNTTFQIGNYVSGLASGGTVIKGAGDSDTATHAVWSLDVGANTTVNLYAAQLSEMRRVTLQATTSMRGCVVKNFGNITANGATIDDCVFRDMKTTAPISGTYGIEVTVSSITITGCTFVNCATAVLWNVASDTNTRLDRTTFISGGTGHAIELGASTPTTLTLTNVTFTGYSGTPGSNPTASSGSTAAAVYNNSGKTITINVVGGTSPAVRNGVGSTTVIVAGTVTTTITAVSATTGAAVVSARVLITAASAGGSLPYQKVTTITRSGATATATCTAHGLATGTKALIKGANQQEYNGVFTITSTGANTFTYTVVGTPATPATGTIVTTGVVIDGVTDGSGVISDTRTHASPQPITGKVRKATGGALYKTGTVSGTVSTTAGFSANVQLIPDA